MSPRCPLEYARGADEKVKATERKIYPGLSRIDSRIFNGAIEQAASQGMRHLQMPEIRFPQRNVRHIRRMIYNVYKSRFSETAASVDVGPLRRSALQRDKINAAQSINDHSAGFN